MKMLVFMTPERTKVAFAPTGQVMLEERSDGTRTMVQTMAGGILIQQPFDQVLENWNAELEMWRQ